MLNNFVSENINCKVTFDLDAGGITIPKVLKTYRSDFG